MSDLRLTGPADEEATSGAGDQSDRNTQRGPAEGRSRGGRIPGLDECLAALAQLPGLIALGLLTPSKANAIRATYTEIIRNHPSNRSSDNHAVLSDSDLLEFASMDPKVLHALSSLLSDEQIEMVMRQTGVGAGGKV